MTSLSLLISFERSMQVHHSKQIFPDFVCFISITLNALVSLPLKPYNTIAKNKLEEELVISSYWIRSITQCRAGTHRERWRNNGRILLVPAQGVAPHKSTEFPTLNDNQNSHPLI